jgi:hypothetical protein
MENFVIELVTIQQQLKIYHWQTKSYARHQAYGAAYDSLSDLIDSFVEVHMGKYGRFTLTQPGIELSDLSDSSAKEFVDGAVEFLINLTERLDPKDTDLLNIRDEMLAVFNRLKYLMTLQ